MLYVPKIHDDEFYTIAAIDPGTRYLGLAIIDVRLSDDMVLCTRSFTLTPSDMYVSSLYNEVSRQSDLSSTDRINLIVRELLIILNNFNPSVTVLEAPFFHRRSPMAYGPLLEQVTFIRTSVESKFPWMNTYMYPPLSIKSAVKAKRSSSKTYMKDALKRNSEVMDTLIQNIDTLSEHAIDAICIGLTFLHKERNKVLG